MNRFLWPLFLFVLGVGLGLFVALRTVDSATETVVAECTPEPEPPPDGPVATPEEGDSNGATCPVFVREPPPGAFCLPELADLPRYVQVSFLRQQGLCVGISLFDEATK